MVECGNPLTTTLWALTYNLFFTFQECGRECWALSWSCERWHSLVSPPQFHTCSHSITPSKLWVKYNLPLESNSILTVSSYLLYMFGEVPRWLTPWLLQNQSEVLFLCVDFLGLFEVGWIFSSVRPGISPDLPSLQNNGAWSCKDIVQLSWHPQTEPVRVPWTCGNWALTYSPWLNLHLLLEVVLLLEHFH